MADTMQGLKRTDYCGDFSAAKIGGRAVVAGFVQKIRDKGGIVFIDLRDKSGVLQLVFDDSTPPELKQKAATCRQEFVLMAAGAVRERASKNPEIPTGDVELFVDDLRILSKAQTPPFEITGRTKANEELRLKYRYLDLRRAEMQRALQTRHKIVKAARDFYDQNGFIEIETPMLQKSTPEGARDYIVPSRVHPGEFYALPQSPQQFKQLLMLAGFDRYMQVVRCFRDEDLRADRQPEFTQIDVEMSFIDEDDVMSLHESLMQHVFKETLGVDVALPFKRLTYAEAMSRYGSDKPDTRFGMELHDLSAILANTGFKVFAGALATGSVRAVNAKNAADKLTRKELDKLVEFVKTYRAKGLAYTRLSADGESSSYEKFLTDGERIAIREALNAEPGDVVMIVADPDDETVCTALGALRCHLAEKLGLIPENAFNFLWVVDFPLFEYDEEENRFSAKHHPFTSPKAEDFGTFDSDQKNARARAYDMVLNGTEIGGGSIRINDPDIQARMFKALGMSEETAKEKFGFFLEAFTYGAPPHGGIAFGLDRIVMLMLDKASIRDVIAFPKVQNARDLMNDCPSPVEQKSLDELNIAIRS